MFKKVILFGFLLSVVFSCKYFQNNKIEGENAIAKVNNSYLYKEDVAKLLPNKFDKKDSVLLVKNIIKNWAKREILLYKAKINLKNEASDIDILVKKYKQDLLINKYREAVVNQNLDTIISAKNIDDFYEDKKEILILNEDLLKLKFIKISNEIIDIEKIRKIFKSDKKEDAEELKANVMAYKSFHFNDSIWIKYADVQKSIPVLSEIDFKKIVEDRYMQLEDASDIYMIRIKEKLNKNTISPKSYALPSIRQMILHSRKLELLKDIEKTLLNDAHKNGKYEIYK